MLKSIGFSNAAIVKWQVLRIGIIMLISNLLAILLANPIGQITIAKSFEMMGATHVDFVVKPLEVYVIYPLIIFMAAMIASVITATQITKISVQETKILSKILIFHMAENFRKAQSAFQIIKFNKL
jgi:putative ABC transport system permease protein